MHYLYPFATVSFAYPWALLFPFLVLFLRMTRSPRGPAIIHASTNIIRPLGRGWRVRLRGPVLGSLYTFFIIALSIAAARPQRITFLEEDENARNIVLVLDLSRSMSAEDFGLEGGRPMNRLEAVKQVVSEFVAARSHDRLGLVVFGDQAFVQCPLTMDHKLVLQLIDRLRVGMAGDATAIGDGLGMALKRVQENESSSSSIILLTDGVSNAGRVSPVKAAQVARDLGVKVHTIGIGSNRPVVIQIPGGLFTENRVRRVEFDEGALKEVASTTGGLYFNAENIEGLKAVYREIDKLEQSSQENFARQRVDEQFWPYALAALLAYGLAIFLAGTFFLKVP